MARRSFPTLALNAAVDQLPQEDLSELVRLEEAMWRTETRFDLEFQQRYFAPDFFEFGRSGRIYSREQTISLERQPIQAVLPLKGFTVRLLDHNTAQVTYFSEVTYGEVTEYARRSSIWSRSGSHWVMRFHQGTPYVPGIEG